MAGDDHAQHRRAGFAGQRAGGAAGERGERAVVAEADDAARAHHRGAQGVQPGHVHGVRLFDVDRFARGERARGVGGVAGVVRRDVDQVDRGIGEEAVGVGGGVGGPVSGGERGGVGGIDVHRAPDRPTRKIVGDRGEREVAAADQADVRPSPARALDRRVVGARQRPARAHLGEGARGAVQLQVAPRLGGGVAGRGGHRTHA